MLHLLPLVRKDRNLTLDQLARLVGTHRALLGRFEHGERPGDAGMIQRLADALGVSADVLTAEAITVHRDGRIKVAR